MLPFFNLNGKCLNKPWKDNVELESGEKLLTMSDMQMTQRSWPREFLIER